MKRFCAGLAVCMLLLNGETVLADSQMETTQTEVYTQVSDEHVHGILGFSVIEGMTPDVLAGVTWDETVKDVTADSENIDFTVPGNWPLTYTILYSDGSTETRTVDVVVNPNLEFYLYGMEGKVEIPVGGEFDPMEHLVWEEQIETVEANMSELDTSKPGDYLITYKLTAPDGREQTTVRQVSVTEGSDTDQVTEAYQGGYSTVTDLGLWRLTAYMDIPADQGPYVGQTSSGAPLVAGRTVAVSQATCQRLGLKFGDQLMIEGHIYVLEDHGGAPMYNRDWVDIYVDNVQDEYSEKYNHYAEVYLLR